MSCLVSERLVELFPRDFLLGIVQAIEAAYPAASLAAEAVDEHIRRNVAGVQRWGLIESKGKALADKHDVEACWVPNSTQSAFHVELRAAEFLLTIAKTDERGKLPPEAEFRNTLVAASQLRLFPEEDATGTHILGIVVHGPDEDGSAPRFIDVLFPDPDGQIVERFDLLSFARSTSKSELEREVVEDAVRPEIRRHGDTGTQGS